MTPCEATATMRSYGLEKTQALLASMAEALNAAAHEPTADAVHDMRVAIRRLQQGFRLFRQYLPKRGVRAVRKTLKAVMERAGELRNCDIAIELAEGAPEIVRLLRERRAEAQQALASVLSEVASPGLAHRWSLLLKLEPR